MQYSITLHRTLFVQGWCDVLEQDRTVESSTSYGIGMLSLCNGLLQKSAFLRHNRCIELGKRYIKALALSNSRLENAYEHSKKAIHKYIRLGVRAAYVSIVLVGYFLPCWLLFLT